MTTEQNPKKAMGLSSLPLPLSFSFTSLEVGLGNWLSWSHLEPFVDKIIPSLS